MPKSRINVKEVKKNIKVTELKSAEPSLEDKVMLESRLPPELSSRSVNPTLAQNLTPQFTPQTRTQVREGLQGKDREFSYLLAADNPSRRSYDPSIKSDRETQLRSLSSTGEPMNPTIRQSSLLRGQVAPSTIIDISQSDLEPSLRRFRDEPEDYRVEKKSVDKYMAKRRSDI